MGQVPQAEYDEVQALVVQELRLLFNRVWDEIWLLRNRGGRE